MEHKQQHHSVTQKGGVLSIFMHWPAPDLQWASRGGLSSSPGLPWAGCTASAGAAAKDTVARFLGLSSHQAPMAGGHISKGNKHNYLEQ